MSATADGGAGERGRQGATGMVSILIGTAGEGGVTLRGGAAGSLYIISHPKLLRF